MVDNFHSLDSLFVLEDFLLVSMFISVTQNQATYMNAVSVTEHLILWEYFHGTLKRQTREYVIIKKFFMVEYNYSGH